MRRMITILYGEMGSGKTYRGQKVAARAKNTVFLEGDAMMTSDMIARVKSFRPLTKTMLDNFVHCHLTLAIVNAVKFHNVVVAQALYRREHRVWLKSYFEQAGHEVQFVKINVPFIQNVKQLLSRPRGLMWVIYWLINKPFFQNEIYATLRNDNKTR